ncbi:MULTISPECIES: hypothetical protein [unclassified Mesorhizobium]|uniref:hypothetical protein n=1 Tax=unclassified Mesorhizobium TaxID=325217 RepID=UPI0012EC36E7|nr:MULTISPECIES: hypothetical protein [unclassified Mesorhizobium]WJI74844.1 hypothetical protein NLY37_28680 [Mesorhizobium sp. C395A]
MEGERLYRVELNRGFFGKCDNHELVALGGIEHETNTYHVGDAQLSDFNVVRGQSRIDGHQGCVHTGALCWTQL